MVIDFIIDLNNNDSCVHLIYRRQKKCPKRMYFNYIKKSDIKTNKIN